MNDDVLRAAYARVLAERAPSSRENCPAPEALLAVVKREGDDAARHRALDHVSRCVDCRRDLDTLRAVQTTRPPVVRRFSAWAAAAAILVVASLPIITRAKQPAVEVERAAGDVVLMAPRGDVREARATEPVILVWRPVRLAERYDVAVVADDGSTPVRQTTPDTTLLVSSAAALAAGREYVWTVTAHLVDGGERRSEPVRFKLLSP